MTPIERAIERIEELKKSVLEANEYHRVRELLDCYDECIEVLKEEASKPEERQLMPKSYLDELHDKKMAELKLKGQSNEDTNDNS